ncbi:hypothetical protein P3T27_004467 [Kitasatospora sp. MAA19]|nr:hypothetical protein [Kitasatospora sp. MAA19]
MTRQFLVSAFADLRLRAGPATVLRFELCYATVVHEADDTGNALLPMKWW